MNAFYRKISYVIALCFMLGIIAVVYYLYVFPDRIVNVTKLIDYNQVDDLWPVMKELYLIIGTIMGLGVLALLLLLLKRNNDGEANVVYIEKFKQNKKEHKDNQQQEETEKEESQLTEKVKEAIKGINDVKQLAEKALSSISNEVEACQAALYLHKKEAGKNIISLHASYAFVIPESQQLSYEFGEGLAGQVAKEGKPIYISDIPDGYIKILSGLGGSSPKFLMISPLKYKDKVVGVCEIASFVPIKKKVQAGIEETLNWLSPKLAGEKSKKEEEPK